MSDPVLLRDQLAELLRLATEQAEGLPPHRDGGKTIYAFSWLCGAAELSEDETAALFKRLGVRWRAGVYP